MRERDLRKLVREFSGTDFKNFIKVDKVLDEYLEVSPFNKHYCRMPFIKRVELAMRLAKLELERRP